MAFEQLDRGSIKVVASVNTGTGDVEAQGVMSAAAVRTGQIRLTVREQMGASEFVYWGTRVDERGGTVRVVRVDDETFDVTTVDAGGGIEAGRCVVFIARITPLGLIAAGAPTGGLAYVVNSDTGDDGDDGTAAAPLASLDEAVRRATASGQITQVTEVLLQPAAAGYALTAPIPAALLLTGLFIRVDESQAGAFTVIDAQVSQAGTNAETVIGAGLVANAHEGQWIRFTDGPAVGERRQIRSNTTTDIETTHSFSVAPNAGDTFEIFEPAVSVDMAAFGFFEKCSNLMGPEDIPGATNEPNPALVWAWLDLQNGNLSGGPHATALYGVSLTDCLISQSGSGCLLAGCDSDAGQLRIHALLPTLLGEPEEQWFGSGFRALTTPLGTLAWNQAGGRFLGYAVSAAVEIHSADFRLAGGAIVSDEDRQPLILDGVLATSWISAGVGGDNSVKIDRRAAPALTDQALLVQGGAEVSIGIRQLVSGGVEIASSAVGVHVRQASRVWWSGPDVAGDPVNQSFIVRHGSRVSMSGAPVFGDAALADYSIGDGTPRNKSFFAAAGDTMCWVDSAAADADASAIERVS